MRPARRLASERTKLEQLVAVVEPFDHRTRQALYAAANSGLLARRTWNGCAFARAAEELGAVVRSNADAAQAFGVSEQAVADFLAVWDGQRGSDARCTARLRDAVLVAGLFPPAPAPSDGRCRPAPQPAASPKPTFSAT